MRPFEPEHDLERPARDGPVLVVGVHADELVQSLLGDVEGLHRVLEHVTTTTALRIVGRAAVVGRARVGRAGRGAAAVNRGGQIHH
jgi:hypothetical protein